MNVNLLWEEYTPLVEKIVQNVKRECGRCVSEDDLRQEAYIAFRDACGRYRKKHGTKLSTWVYLWVMGRLKRVAYYSRREVELDASGEQDGGGVDFDKTMRVRLAIDSMPDDLQTIIVMRFYRDMTFEQIAKKLRLSQGTVWERYSKALRLLRKRIKRMERSEKKLRALVY